VGIMIWKIQSHKTDHFPFFVQLELCRFKSVCEVERASHLILRGAIKKEEVAGDIATP